MLLAWIVLAAAPLGLGADGDVHDSRTVEVAVQSDRWHVESLGETEGVFDALVTDATVAEARWLHRYRADASDATRDLAFSLQFHSVVEFQDLNGDGRYGLGDLVDQSVLVRDLIFPQTSHQGTDTLDNVSIAYRFQSPTRGSLHITETFRSAPDPATNATALDIDLALGIMGFHVVGDNSSHLAIVMRAGPAPNVTAAHVVTEDKVSTFDLSWNASGEVDGAGEAIGVTIETNSGGGMAVVVVALPIGDAWSAEGRLSVRRNEEPQPVPSDVGEQVLGDWRPYVIGIVAAGVLTATAAYLRIRRSR